MTAQPPRLSPSIARHILTCPLRAYYQHRLLGNRPSEPTDAMLAGSKLERLITGHELKDIVVLDYDDYKTRAAKEARDSVTAAGKIPMKRKEHDILSAQASSIRKNILVRVPEWADATHQFRMEWEQDGVLCSGVADQVLIYEDSYVIFDLKGSNSADPEKFGRTCGRMHYDMQQAAYVQAFETLYPQLAGRGQFVFLVYEFAHPYCVTPCVLDGAYRRLGQKKWSRALRTWSECLRTNEWPEYVKRGEVHIIDCKPWQLTEEDLEDDDDDDDDDDCDA